MDVDDEGANEQQDDTKHDDGQEVGAEDDEDLFGALGYRMELPLRMKS